MNGNIKSNSLRGKISAHGVIYGKDAYELAVMKGFDGTLEEWIDSLKGEQGEAAFIRYSAHADDSNFTEKWSEGQRYIGFATGQTAPTDKNGYTWLDICGKGYVDSAKDELKEYADDKDQTLKSELEKYADGKDDELNDRINTVEIIAKGGNSAVSFADYQTMITALNGLPKDKYTVGQNVMIVTLDVPDLWISNVADTKVIYSYTTDAAFVTKLKGSGSVKVGYFVLSALETQKVDLTEYAKTDEVNEKLSEKLNAAKANGFFRAYVVGVDGKQGATRISAQNMAETFAYRDTTGNFKVSDPTGDLYAANKRYVDKTGEELNQSLKGIGSVALTINPCEVRSFMLDYDLETKKYKGIGLYCIYTLGSSATNLKIYDIDNQTQKTISAQFMILALAPYENDYTCFKATVVCYNGVLGSGEYSRIDTAVGENIYIYAPSDAVTHVSHFNGAFGIPFPT
ncbi:MAG: hypothetical protein J6S14_05035 [Clostridia bacterium]|nr:hypothetical protein [Clostridia bacterium]